MWVYRWRSLPISSFEIGVVLVELGFWASVLVSPYWFIRKHNQKQDITKTTTQQQQTQHNNQAGGAFILLSEHSWFLWLSWLVHSPFGATAGVQHTTTSYNKSTTRATAKAKRTTKTTTHTTIKRVGRFSCVWCALVSFACLVSILCLCLERHNFINIAQFNVLVDCAIV